MGPGTAAAADVQSNAPEATPSVPHIPELQDGTPKYRKIGVERISMHGMPRNFPVENIPDEGEAAVIHRALVKFMTKAKLEMTVSTRDYVTDRHGKRKIRRIRTARPATLDDVLGATLHFASMSGARYGRDDVHISFTLDDGQNFEITVDGKPKHTCIFCGGHQMPQKLSRERGNFHQACLAAAELEEQHKEVAIRDKAFAKAKYQ